MFLSVFDMFKVGIGPSSSPHDGPDGRRRAVPRHPARLALPSRTGCAPRCTARWPSPASAMPPTARRSSASPGSRPTPTTPKRPKPRCPRSATRRTDRRRPACRRCTSIPPRDLHLRLRPAAARPCQRHDPARDRRAGRRDPAGDLLFHRRRLRADRGRTGRGGRRQGKSRAPTCPTRSRRPPRCWRWRRRLGPDHRRR